MGGTRGRGCITSMKTVYALGWRVALSVVAKWIEMLEALRARETAPAEPREEHPDLDTVVQAHMRLRRALLMLAKQYPKMGKRVTGLLKRTEIVYGCGCLVEEVGERFQHDADCRFGNFGKGLAALAPAPAASDERDCESLPIAKAIDKKEKI